jgi:DNA replicative helicase MCM subunit Mcm2 (Cdc46/Mcm family)
MSVPEEKLSRLFADLRCESTATGSLLITVRHLENMIYMAEASTRMSLRKDVDKENTLAVCMLIVAIRQLARVTHCAVLSPPKEFHVKRSL